MELTHDSKDMDSQVATSTLGLIIRIAPGAKCMIYYWLLRQTNTLWPKHNGRHFADDILKCIFLNENAWIPIEISLKFVPKGPIDNIPALVKLMAWRRPGDKPLPEPMMVRLPTHICVTRPQWVKAFQSVVHMLHMCVYRLQNTTKAFLQREIC